MKQPYLSETTGWRVFFSIPNGAIEIRTEKYRGKSGIWLIEVKYTQKLFKLD